MNQLKAILSVEIPQNRILGLDILRAYAIIVVLLFHIEEYLPKVVYHWINDFAFGPVDVFFVLSGFLIGNILIKIDLNAKKLTTFWKKRWLRTLPLYFLILSYLLIIKWVYNDNFELKDLSYSVFLQNFVWQHSFFGVSWSLSVEEWFYLIVPIVIIAFKYLFKDIKRSVFFSVFLIIFLTLLYRYSTYIVNPVNSKESYFAFRQMVVFRFDAIMFGVALVYFITFYRETIFRNKNRLLILSLVLHVILKYYEVHYQKIPYFYWQLFHSSIQPFIIALMFPFFIAIKNRKGFIYKAITMISLVSYSMYLIHLDIVKHQIIPYIHQNVLLIEHKSMKLILYFAISILCSILLYKYFELPIIKWRDKTTKQ